MYLGIDSGSTTTKLALVDSGGNLLAHRVASTGLDAPGTAARLWAEIAAEMSRDVGDIPPCVATGYARRAMSMARRTMTEISCHGRGVHHLLPGVREIIDIGGQDSKAIRLDEAGRVEDFAMNDKCAAGTGRFLEVVAQRFEIALEDMDKAAGGEVEPVEINSTCAVFAETEVVGLLAHGHDRAAILAGVHRSLARRVAALAQQLSFRGPTVAFSGGVALNRAMVRFLSEALGLAVEVVPHAQLTAAVGAALLARES